MTLIAVSKGFPAETIQEAYKAGLPVFGENRIQEAEEKIKALPNAAKWHLIGHLQSNKAPKALELGFDLIQSVDSLKLAETLSRRQSPGKTQRVLLEINVAEEKQKSGLVPHEAVTVFEQIRKLPGIQVDGLMCMGPAETDPEAMRPYFKRAKSIFEEMKEKDTNIHVLSMGMSQDFEVAIEEGSTMVRVGKAIFGNRVPPVKRKTESE